MITQPNFIPYFPEIVQKHDLSVLAGLLYGFISYYSLYSQKEFRFTDDQLGKILGRKRTQVKSALRELRMSGLIESHLSRYHTADNNCEKEYERNEWGELEIHECTYLCQFSTKTPRVIVLQKTPVDCDASLFIPYKLRTRTRYSFTDRETLLFGLLTTDQKRNYKRSKQEIMELLGYTSEKTLQLAYKKFENLAVFEKREKNRPQIINNIISNTYKANNSYRESTVTPSFPSQEISLGVGSGREGPLSLPKEKKLFKDCLVIPVPVYEVALEYVDMGFRVIPVNPRTKQPLISGWDEYQHRENTQEELFYWFGGRRSDVVGIGLLTGKASGFAIVDDDSVKHGEEGIVFDSSVVAETRSGGKHYFVKYEEGMLSKIRANGTYCDVLGDARYIVASPTPGYDWIKPPTPEALASLPLLPDELSVEEEKVEEKKYFSRPLRFSYTHKRRHIEDLFAKYSSKPVGERNRSLFEFSLRASLNDDVCNILPLAQYVNDSFDEPLSENELRKTVLQGVKYATLILERSV